MRDPQAAAPVQPPSYPGLEDATVGIQRITDEAVPERVAEQSPSIQSAVRTPPVQVPTDDAAADMKTARTSGVVRAGALMAVATVVSRVTGLLSKIAIAAIIGSSVVNSSYTLANTLPNIMFELLIGGVLTSVAIPLLTRAQRDDADGGLEYTQRLLTLAAVILAGATVVTVLAAPLLTRLYLSAGSKADPALATEFARFLLPQMFFYGIAALFGAVLNTKERFAANAWAPVVNNLVVIGVAVVLAVRHGGVLPSDSVISTTDLVLLGVGTTAGIVIQSLVMIPSLRRSSFRWKWRWGWDPRFAEARVLLGWATVYVLLSQVGVVATTRVASGTSEGGIFFFQTASLIFQMPYGILGVALLTAIMPRMSRHAAAGELDQVKQDMSLANRLSAIALLPVSAALLVVGTSVTVVLYRHGQVDLDDTLVIGGIVGGMALGLLPLAVTLVQMRVFYAMKDGRTPALINAVMVAVRVPLILLSARVLRPEHVIAGVAVATAISYLVGAVVGELWLRARFGAMGTRRTLVTVGKMALASGIGGVAAYLTARSTVGVVPTDLADAVAITVVGGVTGLLVIALLATLFRVEELVPLRRRIFAALGFASPAVAATPTVTASADPPAAVPAASAVAEPPPAVPPPAGPPPAGPPPAGPPGRHRNPIPAGPNGTAVPAGRPAMEESALRSAVDVPAATARTRNEVSPLVTSPPAEPTVELSPGATVGGRYRLITLLGVDAAGNRFWRAKDTVLPRDMAVTLLPEGPTTAATVARTLRVGRLHHIGLPQTLDVGTEQGQSYVVGQWVDGATLADLVAGGPLEPGVATSITAKISEAIAEAHRNGIALGAVNPALIRVNFDGQVRLSHVIAHGGATPDLDIRAVGGLLYLMLTGFWPLPPVMRESRAAALPPAPTRMGVEVPAGEVRPGIPEPLSALAERALHPDEPSGIHAVGAIATLLRTPEVAPAAPVAVVEQADRPALSGAERRLIRERRVKLSVAAVMLAAFAALIIIVAASLSKQVLTSMADSGPTQALSVGAGEPSGGSTGAAPPATSAPPSSKPATARSTPSQVPSGTAPVAPAAGSRPSSAPPSSPPAPPSGPVKIVNATVYDPMGDGNKDYTGRTGRAFDGDPNSSWVTFVYNQQFPVVKQGVGLTLELEKPVIPTSIQVLSETPGTRIEVRAAAAPDLPVAATQPLGSGTITSANPLTIPLTAGPASKYLVVWVTELSPISSGKFQSAINEITVAGR